MTVLRKGLLIGACILLMALPAAGWSQEAARDNTQDTDSQAVIELLKEQNRKLSGDLRRIHRELAALRADLDKPGFKDIAAGVGYIFGICGVAAYFSSRRKE